MPNQPLSYDEWAKTVANPTPVAYKAYVNGGGATSTPINTTAPIGNGLHWITQPQVTNYGGAVPQLSGMPGAQFNKGMVPGGPMQGPFGSSVPTSGPGQSGGGFMAGLGDWLKENGTDLLGLGLGAYGTYQQGKAQDREQDMAARQIAEEQRRYEDERKRKSNAASTVLPMVQGIKDQLDEELRRTAQGGAARGRY
jgi:hypothetical protein